MILVIQFKHGKVVDNENKVCFQQRVTREVISNIFTIESCLNLFHWSVYNVIIIV